jgi:hypothetical protein
MATLAEDIRALEVAHLEGPEFLFQLRFAHSQGLLEGLLENAGIDLKHPPRRGSRELSLNLGDGRGQAAAA